MNRPAVFLDANVLYPSLVREIVLAVAESGLFDPYWSTRVLDEWTIAAVRNTGRRTEYAIKEIRKQMAKRFPNARLRADLDIEARLHLPDPSDVHVAAAASGADILLTFNLRDFPARTLRKLKMTARHPDEFLWEMWSHEPEIVTQAMQAAFDRMGLDWERGRTSVKRARLSRLAKAVWADP